MLKLKTFEILRVFINIFEMYAKHAEPKWMSGAVTKIDKRLAVTEAPHLTECLCLYCGNQRLRQTLAVGTLCIVSISNFNLMAGSVRIICDVDRSTLQTISVCLVLLLGNDFIRLWMPWILDSLHGPTQLKYMQLLAWKAPKGWTSRRQTTAPTCSTV